MCTTIKDLVSKIIIFVVSFVLLLVSLAMLVLLIYAMVGTNVNELIEVIGHGQLSMIMYVLYGSIGFALLTSALGVLGVFLKSKFLLSLYSVCMVVSLLGMGSLVIMWFLYGTEAIDSVETQMYDSLEYSYKGDFSTDPVSIGWNLVQVQFEVCGVRNKTDWLQSDWYAANNTLQGQAQEFPVTCCQGAKGQIGGLDKVTAGDFSEDSFEAQFVIDCYTDETKVNGGGGKGKLEDALQLSILYAAAAGAAATLLQLVLVCAACHLVRSDTFSDDDKK